MTNTTPLPFQYDIVRAKRKTVGIYVQHGIVQVRAPLRVSKQWISDFVSAQSDWVMKRLKKEADHPHPSIELVSGTSFNYMGRLITLQFEIGKKTAALLSDAQLTLTLKKTDSDHIKSVFVQWLKSQAVDYMAPRTLALANQLGLAHKITKIRIRITRTTWGHCSSKGIIQFNPLIMLTEPTLIDYLIAHEVCHLSHMNHSTAYRQLLASCCSDYKLLEKKLRTINHSFGLFTKKS